MSLITTKMITLPDGKPIYPKGGVYGPINTPYRESVRTIGVLLMGGYNVIEVINEETRVALDMFNFDQDNSNYVDPREAEEEARRAAEEAERIAREEAERIAAEEAKKAEEEAAKQPPVDEEIVADIQGFKTQAEPQVKVQGGNNKQQHQQNKNKHQQNKNKNKNQQVADDVTEK
jgi:hypothetical protein